MAYSIEQLKGAIGSEGGLQQASLFMVQLPPIGSGMRASNLNLFTKSVQVPPRQMNTLERNQGGYRSRVANGSITDDITMTFQLVNSGGVQAYFDAWQGKIWNKETRRAGYFKDYAKQVTIKELSLPKRDLSRKFGGKVLGKIGRFLPDVQIGPLNANFGTGTLSLDFGQNTIRTVRLENAFPTTVGAIDLTNDAEGFAELTVSFTYSEWYGEAGLGGLAAGLFQF